MIVTQPSVEILTQINGKEILQHLELCGRTCYKSEGKITDNSCFDFIERIIKRKHETVLEHFSFSVKFIVDRGVSHEIVRYRIASFSQESTRYCNYAQDKYGSQITVIKPSFLTEGTAAYDMWESAMHDAEEAYFRLLEWGCSPQEARSVLPNSLKTEVVMTANLREWRHFLRLRTSAAAHPQMREVATMLLNDLHLLLPVVFDDIIAEEVNKQ